MLSVYFETLKITKIFGIISYFHFEQSYLKEPKFATTYDFLIPVSLQPDVVDPC